MRSEKISAKELFNAIDQIYEEKGITKEYLIESLKMALEAAYKKNYETNEDILIKIDESSIKVCAVKQVVESVEDPNTQVTLEDAVEADEIFDILMGDRVEPRREFIDANAKYVKNLDY